ncbi:mCG1027101, partial [Mus musculus]
GCRRRTFGYSFPAGTLHGVTGKQSGNGFRNIDNGYSLKIWTISAVYVSGPRAFRYLLDRFMIFITTHLWKVVNSKKQCPINHTELEVPSNNLVIRKINIVKARLRQSLYEEENLRDL